MHDAFIEAFRSIEQYNEPSTFGAWLKKIAINRSITSLRKEELITQKLEDYRELNTNEESNQQHNDFSINDIKRTLTQLPANYKLAFSLYLIEEYDHKEIAEIMSISTSKSRSQLSRAKRQIRALLMPQKTYQYES